MLVQGLLIEVESGCSRRFKDRGLKGDSRKWRERKEGRKKEGKEGKKESGNGGHIKEGEKRADFQGGRVPPELGDPGRPS